MSTVYKFLAGSATVAPGDTCADFRLFHDLIQGKVDFALVGQMIKKKLNMAAPYEVVSVDGCSVVYNQTKFEVVRPIGTRTDSVTAVVAQSLSREPAIIDALQSNLYTLPGWKLTSFQLLPKTGTGSARSSQTLPLILAVLTTDGKETPKSFLSLAARAVTQILFSVDGVAAAWGSCRVFLFTPVPLDTVDMSVFLTALSPPVPAAAPRAVLKRLHALGNACWDREAQLHVCTFLLREPEYLRCADIVLEAKTTAPLRVTELHAAVVVHEALLPVALMEEVVESESGPAEQRDRHQSWRVCSENGPCLRSNVLVLRWRCASTSGVSLDAEASSTASVPSFRMRYALTTKQWERNLTPVPLPHPAVSDSCLFYASPDADGMILSEPDVDLRPWLRFPITLATITV